MESLHRMTARQRVLAAIVEQGGEQAVGDALLPGLGPVAATVAHLDPRRVHLDAEPVAPGADALGRRDAEQVVRPGVDHRRRQRRGEVVAVEDGVAALRQGIIDIFIHDAPTVWRIGGNPGERELIGLYWPLTVEPLAWAVRKSDVPLQFALSQRVNEWKVSGQLQQIMSHWIVMRITTR